MFQLARCRRGEAKDLARARQIGKWCKELIWHLRIVMGDEVQERLSRYSPVGGEDYWDDQDDDEIPPFVYDRPEGDSFYFDLTPIERSVSKYGRTTKGRSISLKRLREQPDAITSLTGQDRAVAKFVRKQSTWGTRDAFEIRDPRALLELSGHPLVFADAEATRPLTLTRELVD